MPPLNDRPLEHFLRRTRMRGDCLEWQGSVNRDGYGQLNFWQRFVRANRLAWAFSTGEWPQQCVLHRCDNPRCVRPSHLFLGTHADNMRDMVAKGRARSHRGEAHGMAKLSREQVHQLRRDRAALGLSYPKLARKYAISTGHAYRIVKGAAWT